MGKRGRTRKNTIKRTPKGRMEVIDYRMYHTDRQTAAHFHTTDRTIRRIRERFHEDSKEVTSNTPLKNRPGQGTMFRLDDERKRFLVELVESHRYATDRELTELFNNAVPESFQISIRTLSRYVKKAGFDRYKAETRPLLTEDHMRQRREQAIELLRIPYDRIIYIDEKKYYTNAINRRHKVLRKRGDHSEATNLDALQIADTFHQHVMYLTAVSWDLNICKLYNKKVDGNMDSTKMAGHLRELASIVTKNAHDNSVFYIQYDGSSSHTGGIAQRGFKGIEPLHHIQQPSHSPELNALDAGVFATTQKEFKKSNYTSIEDVDAAVRHIWNQLSEQKIRNAIKHCRHNLIRVLIHDGGCVINEKEKIPDEIDEFKNKNVSIDDILKKVNEIREAKGQDPLEL